MSTSTGTTQGETIPSRTNNDNNYISTYDLLASKNIEFKKSDGSADLKEFLDYLPYPDFKGDEVQAVKLPNSKEEGHSSIYRSSHSPSQLVSTAHPRLNTAFNIFEVACELYGDQELFGTRLFNSETGKYDDFYTFQTYPQVRKRRNDLGSGIMNLFPNKRDFVVSIFSPNRPEFLITEHAASAYSLPMTSLYDTLVPKTTEYILNLTESPILVCPIDKILKILSIVASHDIPHLKYIISMDPINFDKDFGIIQLAKENHISIMSIDQLEAIGAKNPIPFIPPKPETLFAISFTSGTTGNPKGVKLSHKSVSAAIGGCISLISKPLSTLKEGEVPTAYSFLPLAHIYELLTGNLSIIRGFRTCFPNRPSDPANFVENMKICKPHFINLVPRVLNRFESVLKQGLSSTMQGRYLLSLLVGDSIPDWLRKSLQTKTRKTLGFDRVSFTICGSAPISPHTITFLNKILGIGYRQGYGMTESFSFTSASSVADPDYLNCGGVSITQELRLKDVPDMGYLTVDENGNELEEPRGEILLRGPQILDGYYKNPEATKETLNDGWYSTGDVGHVDKLGRIYVIDRVKNFFKLSQGEYVSPEKIESVYMSECDYLSQIFVAGVSIERYLVGVVGIDPIAIRKIFKKLSHVHGDNELVTKINKSTELKKDILHLMNKNVSHELQGFEKIHNLIVAIEPLKIEDETITPTFKVKRPNANKFFKKQINDMYSQGDLLRGEKI